MKHLNQFLLMAMLLFTLAPLDLCLYPQPYQGSGISPSNTNSAPPVR